MTTSNLYEKALELDPNNADILNNLGVLHQIDNDLQKAKECYEKALTLNPSHADALNNLGALYKAKNDLQKAEECYEKTLELNPSHADALSNLGAIYKARGDLQKAEVYYTKAIGLDPNHLDALSNLGVIHQLNNDLQKAQECHLRVLEIDPEYADAYNNLGVLHKAKNDLQKAEEYYAKAIELNPGHLDTLLNLSLLYLLQQRYEEGFALYVYRHHKYNSKIISVIADQKNLFEGVSELTGKRFVINSEQGFGDAIQYSRFFTEFTRRGAEVTCYIFEPLYRLFSHNFSDITFVNSEETADFDYDFPLLDVTYLLGTTYDTIPNRKKYIGVDEADLKSLIKRYHLDKNRKKIGFAFKGSEAHHNNKNRSIELELLLKSLAALKGDVELFSLQYGLTSKEKKILDDYGVEDLGSDIADFYDTALRVEAMDLILSVDTSLVHLSGAMGKNSFLILPYSPDWRWGIAGNRTNWYDSVKIFRQSEIFDWTQVLHEVIESISEIFYPTRRRNGL